MNLNQKLGKLLEEKIREVLYWMDEVKKLLERTLLSCNIKIDILKNTES